MRISDWSSDVCSSDLSSKHPRRSERTSRRLPNDCDFRPFGRQCRCVVAAVVSFGIAGPAAARRYGERHQGDRKSVVEGKSVEVRVDRGGRRIIKKKNTKTRNTM